MDITAHEAAKPGSNRSFGITIGIVFLLIAGWPLLKGNQPYFWALVPGVGFFLAGLWLPHRLTTINQYWFKFGQLLGFGMLPLIMGLMYALAILPVGLLRKALGHDPLRLRTDKAAPSYWIVRTDPTHPMNNQF